MFDKKMIVSVATGIVIAAIILHVLALIGMKMGLGGHMKYRDGKMSGEKHMVEDGAMMEGDAMMEVEVQ